MRTWVRQSGKVALGLAGIAVLAVLIWQGITAHGAPDPQEAHLSRGAVIVNSGILVFREGLEAILVLAAITASMMGTNAGYRKPVAVGVGAGLLATVATWFVVVAVINAVNAPALYVQAVTGVLAIVVLLVIMNWFFHSVYWAGWIGHHNRRRQQILADASSASGADNGAGARRTLLGLALLGFTAMYREGVEVVLFLQNLRLQMGTDVVLAGVALGGSLTVVVAALTFAAHHKLPYKKMLVLTGVMLGAVLIVMVGESAQELQLAGWLPTTNLPLPLPAWLGVWFAVFPTLETLLAQALAAVAVIGSYVVAEHTRVRVPRRKGQTPARRPEAPPTARPIATTTRHGASSPSA